MKIKTKIATHSIVATIGILAAASSVSDSVIKIVDPQVHDYIHQKIASIGTAVHQVMREITSVSPATNEPLAVAISVDKDVTSLTTAGVERALWEDSGHSLVSAVAIAATGTGLLDVQASQMSGGSAGTQSGRTIPVNYASPQNTPAGSSPAFPSLNRGMPTGVPVIGAAPKTLWGMDGRGLPFILIDPLTKLKPQINAVVPKTTTPIADAPKPCNSADASEDNCNSREITDVTLHMEVGDPIAEVGHPLAQTWNDVPTSGIRAAISESNSYSVIADTSAGALFTSTGDVFSLLLTSGPTVSGGESLITASLSPSAIPTPATLPLLGFGLGCMIWLSRPRQRHRTTTRQR